MRYVRTVRDRPDLSLLELETDMFASREGCPGCGALGPGAAAIARDRLTRYLGRMSL